MSSDAATLEDGPAPNCAMLYANCIVRAIRAVCCFSGLCSDPGYNSAPERSVGGRTGRDGKTR